VTDEVFRASISAYIDENIDLVHSKGFNPQRKTNCCYSRLRYSLSLIDGVYSAGESPAESGFFGGLRRGRGGRNFPILIQHIELPLCAGLTEELHFFLRDG